MRGVSITVLRGEGSDPFGDNARANVGTVTGVSIIAPSGYDVDHDRRDTTTTTTRAFIPRSNAIRVRHRDHLVLQRDGNLFTYVVDSDAEYDEPQITTGRTFKYRAYPVSLIA